MAKTPKNKNKPRLRQRKSRRELGSRMYKNYSEEMLMLACEAVQSGQISTRDAQRQFGIPRRTIVNKIKQVHTKSIGHPTVLTNKEEDKIIKVLQASSNFGSPLTKLDLKLLVHEYIKKNSRDHIFKNKIPGDGWVQSFLARHADELTLRTTQNISKVRAEKGAQEIHMYFNNLNTTLKDIPAENIVNFDETNLSDDPGSSKCIYRRGVKYPERIVNSTKGNISLMFTATASGRCLPLYIVYKATNLYSEWVNGGPPDTRYNCSKSGWFDSAIFENYFETIILTWAKETVGTKVAICDNLSSHLSIKVVELCEQHDIKLVFIPPRSTHLTQPLDVAFFAPLKRCWRKILYQYKLKNPTQTTLNKKHFPKLLSELTNTMKITEKTNIISGFRASGIYPLNPHEVLKKIPEMQEEIMSFGIDQVLVDYLRETRAQKPMQVPRNKKIHCEPGKSVSINDLNIDTRNKKTKKKSTKVSNKKQKRNDKSVLYLDDQTGLYIVRNYAKNLEETFNIPQCQVSKIPESLSKQCIDVINSYLGQSLRIEKAKSSTDLLHLNNSRNSITNTLTARKKYDNSVQNSSSNKKIRIISNVLIKAGSPSTNVCVLKEASCKIENKPFIATHKNDLPECLQEKKKKLTKKIDKKHTRKYTGSNRTKEGKNNSKCKKSVQGRTKIKRKSNRYDSESSSVSTGNEFITVDTDDDYETINDFYIAETLRKQEEKENFEPPNTSFGLHEIEYFSENQEKLKENAWIIAKFSTKKSVKHFVGNVLSINSENPIVKFLRKVKESKCDTGMTFSYPTVDDICTIKHLEDVVTVLPEPTITRRGRILFHVDFSNFNIQ
ncbi:unnamed protein product [Pieris macdunnoughi]|uniref:Uncharacterized protein n=1 Tax=Pieris macdunnoughi TaxID=345717 RepID=A0A821UUY9_9NEOP|nr:unnamed protein product [Pieris macdunnoughi]